MENEEKLYVAMQKLFAKHQANARQLMNVCAMSQAMTIAELVVKEKINLDAMLEETAGVLRRTTERVIKAYRGGEFSEDKL